MPVVTAVIEGQTFPADLGAATALEAVLYEQVFGSMFDVHLATLWARAVQYDAQFGDEADKQWSMIDRAVIKWLALRQLVGSDKSLAEVLASVTFQPLPDSPGPEGSGVVVAPEPDTATDEVRV